KLVIPLFVAISVVNGFSSIGSLSLLGRLSYLSNIIGLIFGNAVFYLFCALMLAWSGNWMEGKATKQDLFIVVAHSAIPMIIITFFVTITRLLFFGSLTSVGLINIFQEEQSSIVIFRTLNGIISIGQIWSIWLVTIGISEAQNFTNGRAIGNIVFAFIIVYFFIWLISSLLIGL
ncbi:MAG: YIP1 family protein, partial [Bacteroidota bacterium]